MDLKYKTALVTGGTKGIGLAIAKALVQEGLKVAITGRSDSSINEALDSFSPDDRENVLGLVADVSSMDQMNSVTQSIEQKWGPISVLIANAGIGHFATIENLTAEEWNETIDVNLTGVFNSVKSCVPSLKESKGYIITIASLAGTNFFSKGAAYNASKFGLVGFTQAIMLDLREYDIKCTTIMPGSVATYFNHNIPSEKDAWKIQSEDIAQMVVDLLNMPQRTLPSKIEVRPLRPPKK